MGRPQGDQGPEGALLRGQVLPAPPRRQPLPEAVLPREGGLRETHEGRGREDRHPRGLLRQAPPSANVEQHICDVGLEKEYATHTRMSALSGGQKVKVVLAAAMWNQPHILILDEPTNYLDRDSLGALSGAIEEFGGGVVMITHNNEFCSKLCPETWLLQGGRLDCQGDAAWMENVMKEKVGPEQADGNGGRARKHHQVEEQGQEDVPQGDQGHEQAAQGCPRPRGGPLRRRGLGRLHLHRYRAQEVTRFREDLGRRGL